MEEPNRKPKREREINEDLLKHVRVEKFITKKEDKSTHMKGLLRRHDIVPWWRRRSYGTTQPLEVSNQCQYSPCTIFELLTNITLTHSNVCTITRCMELRERERDENDNGSSRESCIASMNLTLDGFCIEFHNF